MEFNLGMIAGACAMFIGVNLGIHFGEADTIFKREVEQAISKCKNGEWEKIDQTTIYCKDGAEYNLEDEQ